MEKPTLIATFYSFEPIVASAHEYSPSRIVLLVAEDSLKNPQVKSDIEKVKDVYDGKMAKVASVEVVYVKGSDLYFVASKTVDLIEKYHKEGPVVVNVSGGWKLLSQGALYGCYARFELVNRIICNNLEDNSVMELPKLTFGLTTKKRVLLDKIASRKKASIQQIADKMDKSRGMLYQHLKELKDMGYVDEKFEITLAGRIALL